MFKFSLFFSFEESQRRALNQIQEHHLVRSTRFQAHAPWNSEPRGANTVGSCKAPRCWYTLLCSQQHQHSQEQGPFLDCKVIQFFRHSLANFKISIPPIMNTCLGNDFPCRHLTCWEDGREARFTDILFCKKAHTLQVKHISVCLACLESMAHGSECSFSFTHHRPELLSFGFGAFSSVMTKSQQRGFSCSLPEAESSVYV